MEPQKYANPGDATPREIRTIDLKTVVAIIQKLADEHPGRIARCTLASRMPDLIDGEVVDVPHAVCIVGHAYLVLGVPVSDLCDIENVVGAERWTNDDWAEHEGPVDFPGLYGIQFTVAARAFMLQVQREQDAGTEWGSAVWRTIGRAHVVFGTELNDPGEIFEHGERPLWPQGEVPTTLRLKYNGLD